MKNKLTFLFDGGCPLCLRETNFLKKRDTLNQISFIDINSKDYDRSLFNDISYSQKLCQTCMGLLKMVKLLGD